MLARGAADDKGQIHLHVMAAAAILATRGAFPVNVRYVFEGEEESIVGPPRRAGSRRTATGSTADVAVISDSGFFEGNIPVDHDRAARHDVRPDRRRGEPMSTCIRAATAASSRTRPIALARIITALKGPDGRILIPGFYDDVVALTDEDRAAFAALPFDEAATPRRSARRRSSARPGTPCSSASGGRPTLDVNGIWGGFHGRRDQDHHPGPRARQDQLPARRRPGPRADLRALPRLRRDDRSPRRHDDRHIPRRRPPEPHADRPPGHPGGARALEATFGRAPVFIREGGSIPVSASFEIDPRPAGRAARLHPARRQRPCPQRVDGPATTTRPASGPSCGPWTSWPTSLARADSGPARRLRRTRRRGRSKGPVRIW